MNQRTKEWCWFGGLWMGGFLALLCISGVIKVLMHFFLMANGS